MLIKTAPALPTLLLNTPPLFNVTVPAISHEGEEVTSVLFKVNVPEISIGPPPVDPTYNCLASLDPTIVAPLEIVSVWGLAI